MKRCIWFRVFVLLFLAVANFSSFAVAEELMPPTVPALPAELSGTWLLTQVTCDGSDSNTVSMSNLASATYSSSISLNSLLSTRSWSYTPGACSQSVPMSAVSASGGNLTFTDGLSLCAGTCFTGCGVIGNTNTFPYTLTGTGAPGSTLDVTVTSYAPYGNPCVGQSGPIVFHYTKI